MIVPFPPGGVADIVGRPLAAMMEKSLKQPVVIVNRTGAGGALGMREVAKAAPDGYTILMGLSSISIFPVSERVNGKQPAYELKDFAPIALVTADPTVLVVRADSPYRSVRDFVEAAKAKPGKINYSSSGVYGTLHVAMEMFANAADVQLFHVPYGGGGPAITALLGGQVEASAQGPAARSAIRRQDARFAGGARAPSSAGAADVQGARLRRRVLHLVGRFRASDDASPRGHEAQGGGEGGGDFRRLQERDGEGLHPGKLSRRARVREVLGARCAPARGRGREDRQGRGGEEVARFYAHF